MLRRGSGEKTDGEELKRSQIREIHSHSHVLKSSQALQRRRHVSNLLQTPTEGVKPPKDVVLTEEEDIRRGAGVKGRTGNEEVSLGSLFT